MAKARKIDRRALMRSVLRAGAMALVALLAARPTTAAPVTAETVRQAAETFVRLRFPAPGVAQALSNQPPAASHVRVTDVTPWNNAGRPRGFVAHLDPAGYVLFRADDVLAPIKSYSDHGSFDVLPPYFRDNLAGRLGGCGEVGWMTSEYQNGKRLALLAAIVDSSDDAIIAKGLDGNVISWNKGAERMYGYTVEEMIGRPVTVLMDKGRVHEMADIIAKVMRLERVEHFETERVAKGGRVLQVSINVSPVVLDGKVIGASAVCRDVTERKRAEAVSCPFFKCPCPLMESGVRSHEELSRQVQAACEAISSA